MARTVLMCEPTYFDIEYEINVWMHQDIQVAESTSHEQWRRLRDIYTHRLGWKVELAPPRPGLPDMVFATDCCLMLDGKALLSSFRHAERRAETAHFAEWFEENGYTRLRQARHVFEGGGDTLVCGEKLLAGYGFRSDARSHDEMREYFKREVVSLQLVDPRFYHLDTCLAVLDNETVAVYLRALDAASQRRLRAAVPNVVEATLEEAQGFGLNAVSDGRTVVTSDASGSLLDKFRAAGFGVIGTPILEFRKSGGGVKCLTLDLRTA
jgi:N-dimethylarginine dimethylaminohydrolase